MTRPQKVTNLRDAENKKISTWLPSNGTGIGLWKGRRVYYVNGKRQSGLTIRKGSLEKFSIIDGMLKASFNNKDLLINFNSI